jgi:hypothetical protein
MAVPFPYRFWVIAAYFPQAAVYGALHGREILPTINPIAPIIQTKDLIKIFNRFIFLPHVFDK